MPELPEVETVRTSLIPSIVGRTVVDVAVGDFAGVLGEMTPAEFRAVIIGERFAGIERRGKYLLLRFDEGAGLQVHLRMTGQLLCLPADHEVVRFQHLAIRLSDGHELRYADQRKFGRVLYRPTGFDWEQAVPLGPEPLDRAFTAHYLLGALARRTGPIKGALLDQKLVAGLGNIYVDEALFAARVHPLRPGNSVTEAEARRIVRSVRTIIRQAIAQRGTTFSSFVDGDGQGGYNQHSLQVYGRSRQGEACPRCGQSLQRLVVAGRGTSFCPRCQPLGLQP